MPNKKWWHFIGGEWWSFEHASKKSVCSCGVFMSGEGIYKLSYCELEEVNAG